MFGEEGGCLEGGEAGWAGLTGPPGSWQGGGEGGMGLEAGRPRRSPRAWMSWRGGWWAGASSGPPRGGCRIPVGTWEAWPAVPTAQGASGGWNKGTRGPSLAGVRSDGHSPSQIAANPEQTGGPVRGRWGGGCWRRQAGSGAGCPALGGPEDTGPVVTRSVRFLGWLKQQKWVLLDSGSWMSQSKVQAGSVPSEAAPLGLQTAVFPVSLSSSLSFS